MSLEYIFDMTKIKITKENCNKDLKTFILNLYNDLTVSAFNKAVKKGDIKVNSKKVFWNYLLQENDTINIFLRLKNPNDKQNSKNNNDFLNSKDELKVFYEDENIIVVIKPRGLICQPDKNEKIDTLNNRIKRYLYLKKDKSYETANLCHRLDKYTTGLCLAGKKPNIIRDMNELWNTDVVQKFYLCLCFGVFKEKRKLLKNYIVFNEKSQKMEIDYDNKFNKEIITSYKVIRQEKQYALLEVKLLTGKKHQIRVHMASIDHPVLGDTKYNKINNFGFRFPCLCSYKLKFNFDKTHYLHYLNNVKLELKNFSFK